LKNHTSLAAAAVRDEKQLFFVFTAQIFEYMQAHKELLLRGISLCAECREQHNYNKPSLSKIQIFTLFALARLKIIRKCHNIFIACDEDDTKVRESKENQVKKCSRLSKGAAHKVRERMQMKFWLWWQQQQQQSKLPAVAVTSASMITFICSHLSPFFMGFSTARDMKGKLFVIFVGVVKWKIDAKLEYFLSLWEWFWNN
jgi:hypothetical protein